MRPNPLRDRFTSGAVALGAWWTMPSLIGAEVMGELDLRAAMVGHAVTLQ